MQPQRQLAHTTDRANKVSCASKFHSINVLVMNGRELSSMEAGKFEQFPGDSFGFICIWNSVGEGNHQR